MALDKEDYFSKLDSTRSRLSQAVKLLNKTAKHRDDLEPLEIFIIQELVERFRQYYYVIDDLKKQREEEDG